MVVSGPVEVDYPLAAEVHPVVSTEEMLEVASRLFEECDGAIGAAAPCDYRPVIVQENKIAKTGEPIELHLIETPDVLATLGANKTDRQWAVAFALETEDQRFRALTKLEKKNCQMVVLNGPEAMNAASNHVEVLGPTGDLLATLKGTKENVARGILALIHSELIDP